MRFVPITACLLLLSASAFADTDRSKDISPRFADIQLMRQLRASAVAASTPPQALGVGLPQLAIASDATPVTAVRPAPVTASSASGPWRVPVSVAFLEPETAPEPTPTLFVSAAKEDRSLEKETAEMLSKKVDFVAESAPMFLIWVTIMFTLLFVLDRTSFGIKRSTLAELNQLEKGASSDE